MQGHWLSQTRKLNRHYQSGSVDHFKDSDFLAWYTHPADSNHNTVYFPTNSNIVYFPSSDYLSIPQNKKIDFYMYNSLSQNDFFLCLGANLTSPVLSITFYDINNVQLSPVLRYTFNDLLNSYNNNFNSEQLYRSDDPTTSPLVLHTLYPISKNRNKPTYVKGIDFSNSVPQNAVKMQIGFISIPFVIGYETQPQTVSGSSIYGTFSVEPKVRYV